MLVSLMILLILTLITLVAMRGTTLQERIAGSTRSLDLSLQAAETALRGLEDQIGRGDFKDPGNLPSDSNFDLGLAGWYMADPGHLPGVVHPVPNPATPDPGEWPAEWSLSAEDFPDPRVYNNPPRYFVEALPGVRDRTGSLDVSSPPGPIRFYRITVAGYSGPPVGGKAAPFSVILQSTFKR